MALGTLLNLRSMVRNRIGQPVQKEGPEGFLDTELNAIINYGQLEVARRLLKINQEWFVGVESPSPGAARDTYTLPSNCLEVLSVLRNSIPALKIAVANIGILSVNANYMPAANQPFYYQIAGVIYLKPTVNPGLVKIYFVKKPVELTTDANVTIIPDEFLDLVISYAVMHCKSKMGAPDMALMEKQYDEKFKEIEYKYRADIDTQLPGERDKK